MKSPTIPPKAEPELPVLDALGVARAPQGGYVVFLVHTKGDKVVGKEILSEPSPKPLVKMQAQIEFVKKVLQGL